MSLLSGSHTISCLHGVETVDVAVFAGASACRPEGYFTQPAYLAHGVGRVEGIDYVQFVAALVGMAQKTFVAEFCLYQSCIYWVYNLGVHSVVVCRREARE